MLSVTFVEGNRILADTTISIDQERSVTFGRGADNDIVVAPPSETVSKHHGVFEVREGRLYIRDLRSKNGLYYNGSRQDVIPLTIGDIVTVGMPARGAERTVIIVGEGGKRWDTYDLTSRASVSIGRASGNDLVLASSTVSSRHAYMERLPNGSWTIEDRGSSNGTRINGVFAQGRFPLMGGSVVMMGNVRAVFLESCLLIVSERQGVEVVATELVRYRTNRGLRRVTTDHVSLRIKRGEFVAIVGGSGCGKSTLLNELSGSDPADEGTVTVDGTDLYANYGMLKSSIGYVPQRDIVYDNLRLVDMLDYEARLRMQPDTTAHEREARVDEVIELLELDGERDQYVRELSGGQRKRASIAIELLADPRLLFLDEPTSGLDPGIERKLMATLANMAHAGRTIIVVTHTTLNLQLCDQVVFLGTGGKLCYAGDPRQACEFFGVADFVDAYNVIDRAPDMWEQKFAYHQYVSKSAEASVSSVGAVDTHRVPSFPSQLSTLTGRYLKLLVNDRSRMALLLLQAPLLAAFIGLVTGPDCFVVYEGTKSCLFSLSCAAFWMGILNAIQEICKERTILRREFEGGMRLSAYILSKVSVLSLLCLVQSVLLVAVFVLFVGRVPEKDLVSAPLELFLSTFLTTCSAMCLGLFVSALVKSPARALAFAPLLIMPQILFSGIVFELGGVTEVISHVVTCRWAMEAYGTTADLNELDLAVYRADMHLDRDLEFLFDDSEDKPSSKRDRPDSDEWEEPGPEVKEVLARSMFPHEPDGMFEHSVRHLLRTWGILALFSVLFVAACGLSVAISLRR